MKFTRPNGHIDETSPGNYQMEMLLIVSRRLIQLNYYCQIAGQYDIFGLELIFKDPLRNYFPNDLAETW